MIKKNRSYKQIMPVRVDRPVSDRTITDMTNLLIAGFENGVDIPERLSASLLTRRMATSYMNRPGSQLTKVSGELSKVIEGIMPDTAHFVTKAKIQGLELVGEGYGAD